MKYEKKIIMKLLLCILFVILGATAFSIGMYIKIKLNQEDFTTGYLTGTGTGLFFVGVVMFIQKLMLLKNKQKLKAHKIENEDERNLALTYKSSHYSLVITTMLLYVSSFYFAFFNESQLSVISTVICILVFVKFVLYYIMKRQK